MSLRSAIRQACDGKLAEIDAAAGCWHSRRNWFYSRYHREIPQIFSPSFGHCFTFFFLFSFLSVLFFRLPLQFSFLPNYLIRLFFSYSPFLSFLLLCLTFLFPCYSPCFSLCFSYFFIIPLCLNIFLTSLISCSYPLFFHSSPFLISFVTFPYTSLFYTFLLINPPPSLTLSLPLFWFLFPSFFTLPGAHHGLGQERVI